MTKIEIFESLKQDNWELRNYGNGWFMMKKGKEFYPGNVQIIDDNLIDEMESEGLIIITIPYKSAIAIPAESKIDEQLLYLHDSIKLINLSIQKIQNKKDPHLVATWLDIAGRYCEKISQKNENIKKSR